MNRLWRRLVALALTLTLLSSPGITETLLLKGKTRLSNAITTLESMKGDAGALEVTGKKSWKRKVKIMNWYKGGSSVLRVGGYGYIYDIRTGIRIRVKRCGGIAHADVEPATKKDTAKLKKIAGGHFSWDRHAVILYAHGKYVACSINTKPHGKQTIKNNGYHGQFCLHMAYSKTHGSNRVDEDHMACIRRAYNWAH